MHPGHSRRVPALVILLCCAVALHAVVMRTASLRAQAPALSADQRQKVDQVFAAFTKPGSPGCALAIYREGAIAYTQGYGLANLEHGVPITPQTVFDIGSTSKQFTAFSILLLERDARLSLDDDVRKFIPELPRYERLITVRHLLQHTSGLRDYLTLFRLAGVKTASWTTQRDAVELAVRQRQANFGAGDDWLYSNTGYLLLAEVVQRAGGKSLKDFARERIFVPLGMTHTFYLDDHRLVIDHRATGYVPRPGGGFAVEMSNFEQIGDGAVQTTVEDLLLWDRNFYAPKVGDAAMLERALRVGRLNNGRVLDYAAGLTIGEYRGEPTVRHGGSWAGYRADLLRFPRQKASIACLCNLGTATPSRLANQVADVVLAGVFKQPAGAASTPAGAVASRVTLSGRALQTMLGIYKSADGREYRRLVHEEGKLSWGAGTVLTPLAPDRFRLGETGSELLFLSAPSGGARECRLVPPPGSRLPPTTYRLMRAVPHASVLAFAGDYYVDELDVTWTFLVKDDSLVLSIRGDTGGPFVQAEAGTFIQDNGMTVEFERVGQTVRGGRLHAGRVRNLAFRRVVRPTRS